MLGKKKNKADFDEKIKQAKYERIFGTLKDILKTDIKTTDDNNKEVTDFSATCSAIKTKARLALDFIADLDGDDND